ncbi:MAG: hypothetical protein R8G01_10665 [Ilumatobacteraceae bacterium]|nr:hypothetical protein [Ilumatobacteraceae bacterium]
MIGASEDLSRRTCLDNATGIHHSDSVGESGNHAEVMRDDQDGHLTCRRQLGDQFQDLCLHGDVQRCGRLIGDQQVGLTAQSNRNRHSLTHPAGELVRVLVETLASLWNSDGVQQVDGARTGVLA